MTENIAPKTETSTETLARSAFGLALLALFFMALTWIALLLSPNSPNALFDQLRTVILIGAGILTLLCWWLMVWIFQQAPDKLHRPAQRWVLFFRWRWWAALCLLLLLEINLSAAFALRDVAPFIIEPLRFLLAGGSLILTIIILVIHGQALQQALERTRGVWLSLGLGMVGLAIFGVLLLLTQTLVQRSGINDRLRGGLDYRPLTFFEDGQPAPSSAAFWAEQSKTRVVWLPYSYWTVEPFDGEFIHVDADGLRRTVNTAPTTASRLYFFGGSTMWGEGARDAYTIPSFAAHLLNDEGIYVLNYGQTGYVSTQDMLLFQMQLLQGNIPEVAVFYQGFNDLLAANLQQVTAVSMQEDLRATDAETGRMLRAGVPVLRSPAVPNTATWELIGAKPVTAEAIVERWFANVQMIRTLAQGYGVKVLFVWQPSILFKATRTPDEEGIVARIDEQFPNLTTLYQEADALVRQRLSAEPMPDVLLLSDLFQSDARNLFYDLVHITESGNFTVAQALVPTLLELFTAN